MATIAARTDLDEDGLCKRCAAIDWEEMALAIEQHFPMLRRIPDQRLHVFDINTTITDTGEVLKASSCRFCRLLGKALTVHNLVTPGQLDCVHDGSSMVSIDMDSMVPALAITLDDITTAKKQFLEEYAKIETIDFESIKSNIHTCEQAHSGCVPDTLGDLPGFRLIDCNTMIVVSARSIVNNEVSAPQKSGYCYVALSYVWGPKPDESRTATSGALENLPQTIEDSIYLCRALGYRYLWVDRYVSTLACCFWRAFDTDK